MIVLYCSLLRAIGNLLIFDKDAITANECFHCAHPYCWKCLIPWYAYRSHTGKHAWSFYTLGVLDLFSCVSLYLLLESHYSFPVLCSYFFFFSALLVTLYTDTQYMLISRFVTLYSIPIVLFFSSINILPLAPTSSILGALSGYCVLYAIAYTFRVITKKDGLGQGDIDLIAFVGSCIGFLGWWTTLLIGSFSASFFGIVFMLTTRQFTSVKLPFGPFLVFGAITYTLLQDFLADLLFAFPG